MRGKQNRNITRREMLGNTGKAAAASVVLSSLSQDLLVSAAIAADPADMNAIAGPDRVTVLPGKTYLMGWAGFGDPAQTGEPPLLPDRRLRLWIFACCKDRIRVAEPFSCPRRNRPNPMRHGSPLI